MTDSVPNFTTQDAQALADHASSAPLQNLQHASKLTELLNKFAAWYHHAAAKLESFEAEVEARVHAEMDKLHSELGSPKTPAEDASAIAEQRNAGEQP